MGNRIWNACNCEKNKPWIINPYYEEDVDTNEIPWFWENANYDFIQAFDLTIHNLRMSFGLWKVAVYQPHDQQSFISMLKIEHEEPDTLLVMPQNTSVSLLKSLLSKTEGHPTYETFSYLSYV